MQTLERNSNNEQRALLTTSPASLHAVVLKNCVWFIATTVLAIVLLESIFSAGHLGEECFIRIQPTTGFGHIPEKLITWRSEGYSQTMFDKAGIREKQIGKASFSSEAQRNVFLLGDSVVEALQVPYEYSLEFLLEKKLNASTVGAPYHLINFGTSAYGTLQEYLQYMQSRGEYKPGTVLLFYHQGDNNDNVFLEGVNNFFPRPYCKTDEYGNLVLDLQFYEKYMKGEMARDFHSIDFLRDNSRIYGTFTKIDLALAANQNYLSAKSLISKASLKISRWLSKLSHRSQSEKEGVDPVGLLKNKLICTKHELDSIRDAVFNPAVEKAQTEVQQGIKINEQRMVLTCGILSALARECARDNCRLVIVGLPAPGDNTAYVRELNSIRKLNDSAKVKFDFVDLNEQFAQMPEEEQKSAYFVYGDHLKAKGHKLAADHLFQHIWNNAGSNNEDGRMHQQ